MKEVVSLDLTQNINSYVEEAKMYRVNNVGALETYIHADFVSRAHDMAETLQATQMKVAWIGNIEISTIY